ncbi:hypothetical protein LMIY3S_05553 [Labrys miyagiensis]
MYFDIVFAAVNAAASAIVIATLSFVLAQTPRGRLIAAAALAAWFVFVLYLGATGSLAVAGDGVAGLGAAVLIPAVSLSWLLLRAGRTAPLARPPVALLVAGHAIRVLGVAFVLLYAAHRLPAPFAPSAGWGDIAIGITALPVAWLAHNSRGTAIIHGWNLLGGLDLVSAIALGATSSPGPARLFLDPPGSGIMTMVPWILIPAFLVPCLFALHVAIFDRLRRVDVVGGPQPIAAR